MSVMLQAFYWDCATSEGKAGGWWDLVAARIDSLKRSGFDSIWLPPVSKAASVTSMGYDPYDYFDLGDYDQKGGVKTLFGNRAELVSLIQEAHGHDMQVYADVVINHNSGADEEEINPLDGESRWTKYTPKSGRFPRDWNSFHPSRYEATLEGEVFAGFPHLCHRNPLVYTCLMEYSQMLIEELGFDGFRFDFVKGYGPWMVGTIAKYRYQRDGKPITPFVVGEYWEDQQSIDEWLLKVNSFSDNQIAAFDFPLRYRLKDMCDTLGYDLRKLTEDGVVVTKRPMHAVTFVDNHDTQNEGAAIANDKMLAYAYILTHEGYPCIFWLDYYNFELARPGAPNGIDALIDVHHRYAGGAMEILHCDPDLYIMQRTGYENQPGLIFVLNNLGNTWSGTSVKTQWPSQRFSPLAWDGQDQGSQPEERTTDAEGNAEFPAPPRGFAVYVSILGSP
jgi:alpha-amylase